MALALNNIKYALNIIRSDIVVSYKQIKGVGWGAMAYVHTNTTHNFVERAVKAVLYFKR